MDENGTTSAQRCQTVTCHRPAVTRIHVQPVDGEHWIDDVCGHCARRYVTYSGTSMVDGATVTRVVS